MKKRVNKSMSENWKRTYVDYDKDKGEDSVSKMMKRVENKIEKFPVLGNPFAKLVIMIDMVRNYIKGSYRDVLPKGEWEIYGVVDFVIHEPVREEL